MNVESLAGVSSKELGLRFNLVSQVPTAFLALLTLAILWSGAPSSAPDLTRLASRVQQLSVAEGALLALAILVLALVLQPLQLALVRAFEGYWSGTAVGALLARPLLARHRRRRRTLERATRFEASDGGRAAGSVDAGMQAAAAGLRRYPREQRLLPTTLGNVLRAAEDRAGGRYGLDAVVMWPRLYPLLPADLRDLLADQRNQLDLAVRFCVTFLATAAVSAALLARYGWWLLVPSANVLLAWVSYQAAIVAAIGYGELVQVAFDLHRFDLLRALHLPLPVSREVERRWNAELSAFLRQGKPIALVYAHPRTEQDGPTEDDVSPSRANQEKPRLSDTTVSEPVPPQDSTP